MIFLLLLFVFLQEAESNRLCRRLQLKDIIPAEMQRVTKYPLLLDNIAKYTGMNCTVNKTAWLFAHDIGNRVDDLLRRTAAFWLVVKQLLVLFVHRPTEDGEEREKVKKAADCCKKILNHVNQAVKEAENKQVQTL